MQKLPLFFVFILVAIFVSAQNQREFNTPGSDCYVKYTTYARNSDYLSCRRPFIFISGRPGESAEQIFEHDSLKNIPRFYNYLFVMVPATGRDFSARVECLIAIASLVTNHFECGNKNIFLQINDEQILRIDADKSALNEVFTTIRLKSEELSQNGKIATVNPALLDFTENTAAYAPLPEADEDDDSDGDEPNGAYIPEEIKAVRMYFGPPRTYNFTLSGTVRDKQTGEALPFATVLVKGTQSGTTTNMDGWFTLQKVPTDTTTLIVQYVGYSKTEVFLSPQLPKTNFLIELQPSSQSLKEIVVSAVREDVVLENKDDVSTIKMTPRKLEQLPNLGERDIMRSFQLLPGISASNESSSGLYVRGGTPDQNLILYDGFTVYHVDHLYGFFSAFNSNALKDVQLYKGGFESRFGGRLSSVTEITGKEGNQKKFNMGMDASLLSVNAFVEIPIGKNFTTMIAYRRSYKSPVYNLIFDKFNQSKSAGNFVGEGPGGKFSQDTKVTSYFYDLNGKMTYHPTKKDIVSLSFFNGTDKLDNSTSSSSSSAAPSNFSMNSTDLTRYGNFGSSLKWSRSWNPKIYGNTILSFSNYYSKRERSQERTIFNSSGTSSTVNNGIFENNYLRDYSLRSDYQWDLGPLALEFGGFGTYYDIKYNYAQSDTASILDRNNTGILAGAYLQDKIKLWGGRVIILPGIRMSYYDITKKAYTEPRISLNYNLTERLSLKGAYGKYYQFANRVTREDILSGSRDFWVLADGGNTPVSSAIHYIGGISYDTKKWLFSAEVYYKLLEGLNEYSLRINASPFGVDYNENFFHGKGYSKGVEFLLQKKSGSMNGWASYTLGEARNYFAVYSDSYYPANQDVTHEFKIVLMYNYKKWDFSATWIWASGRPYTAPSGAYSITLLDGSEQDFFTVTQKNSLRLPDYHRCDISVNYKFVMGQKKKRELGYIGFSIFNLYNRTNVWYKQYDIIDGSILETNVNYLGITPNLTLSLKLR
ncbi:MAG: TonB-dependent receptor [Bacteroidota bacterium]